ncbi:glycoside hydrolase N-terminal domain-containing protein [Promicromonospora xylanilytica]
MTVLEYAGPATEWLHALPLGNGRLGAMCWGGATARFDLNHEGVWSGSPVAEAASVPGTEREAQAHLARARGAVAAERWGDTTEPLQALQAPYAQSFPGPPGRGDPIERHGPRPGTRRAAVGHGARAARRPGRRRPGRASRRRCCRSCPASWWRRTAGSRSGAPNRSRSTPVTGT